MKIEELTGGYKPEPKHVYVPSSGNTDHPVWKNKYKFDDDLLADALAVKADAKDKFSTSLLQRRLGIGYPRAARLREMMEQMEEPETKPVPDCEDDFTKAGIEIVAMFTSAIQMNDELKKIMEENPQAFSGQAFQVMYGFWNISLDNAKRYLEERYAGRN